jgi:alcohol dehydrogenase (cytochrome c)
MKKKLLIIAGALIVIGAVAAGGLYYAYPVQVSTFAGLTRNYFISWIAPPGTTTTELNADYKSAGAVAPSPPAGAPLPGAAGDWPSYNRTFTSERFSQLSEINTTNVGKLKVLCTYDVGQLAAFESGLIMVNNALIGTTQFDIFPQPGDLRRELANARGLSPRSSVSQPRRRLHGRHAVSRHPGRTGASL